MPDTKRCTPDKLLEGFAALSPEDQEVVRVRLLEERKPDKEEARCHPAVMMEQMMEMMSAQGSNPLAMCQEMRTKMMEGGDPTARCRHMMGKKEDICCP